MCVCVWGGRGRGVWRISYPESSGFLATNRWPKSLRTLGTRWGGGGGGGGG